MDRSQLNPARQSRIGEPKDCGQPSDSVSKTTTPAASIESVFPTANANQLLELIAQGHNPEDLHQLIQHSKHAA